MMLDYPPNCRPVKLDKYILSLQITQVIPKRSYSMIHGFVFLCLCYGLCGETAARTNAPYVYGASIVVLGDVLY